MRLLSARLIISLVVGVTLVSLCSSYYQSYVLARGMRHDLEHRAELLGESLSKNVERDLERDNPAILRRTVQQFANREHLAGLAVYDPQGKAVAVATNIQPLMESAPPVVLQCLKEERNTSAFVRMGIASIHIYALPLMKGEEPIGTAARLAVHIQARLEDSRLFVVSNREPYIHLRKGKSVQVSQPASGLVTALEPVLCACGGTWVAHGSGDGDIDSVDVHDRLQGPPDDPHYTPRRVWLSAE